jgi:DNA-binding beta-propeller fold protein YncE
MFRRRHVAWVIPLAVVVAVAGVLATASSGAQRGQRNIGAARVKRLPVVGKVVARIPVDNGPLGLYVAPDGTIWVAAHHAAALDTVDPATNRVVKELPVSDGGDQPGRFVAAESALFEVSYSGEDVFTVDPRAQSVTGKLTLPLENCCWPAYGAGSLWFLGYSSATAANPDTLERVDPATGKVLAKVSLANAQGLVFAAGAVWGISDGSVFRLDPATNTVVARIHAFVQPFAYAAGSIWALGNKRVVRINPATNRITATIALPGSPATMAATNTAVWVAEGPPDTPGHRVWKINPAKNRVVGQVVLPKNLYSSLDDVAVAADGSVWITAFDANSVLRIKPR